MDFGKKKTEAQKMAKKAMKLRWKEGITLKEAWKRVSGKKSKTKSKTKPKMSPKRKKAQAMAKKAMNLKWKEGITLKQAWKKVNKFGDPVCPEGYEANTKWTGGKGQRQCIKKCDFYQMRDPISNRCKNMTIVGGRTTGDEYEMNPLTGRMRKKCKSGYTRSEITGKCRKDRVLQDGYEINPRTGRPRKMCQPGWARNEVTGRCRLMRPDEFLVKPLIAEGIPVFTAKEPDVFPQDPFPNMRPGAARDWMKSLKSTGGKQSLFGNFPMKNTRSLFGKCSFGSCTACNAK